MRPRHLSRIEIKECVKKKYIYITTSRHKALQREVLYWTCQHINLCKQVSVRNKEWVNVDILYC